MSTDNPQDKIDCNNRYLSPYMQQLAYPAHTHRCHKSHQQAYNQRHRRRQSRLLQRKPRPLKVRMIRRVVG